MKRFHLRKFWVHRINNSSHFFLLTDDDAVLYFCYVLTIRVLIYCGWWPAVCVLCVFVRACFAWRSITLWTLCKIDVCDRSVCVLGGVCLLVARSWNINYCWEKLCRTTVVPKQIDRTFIPSFWKEDRSDAFVFFHIRPRVVPTGITTRQFRTSIDGKRKKKAGSLPRSS